MKQTGNGRESEACEINCVTSDFFGAVAYSFSVAFFWGESVII